MKDIIVDKDSHFLKEMEGPSSIIFTVGDLDIIELYENGDIYIRGELAENDKAVVDGLRDFLIQLNKE